MSVRQDLSSKFLSADVDWLYVLIKSLHSILLLCKGPVLKFLVIWERKGQNADPSSLCRKRAIE
jgi:hypothetical protein